MVPARRRRHWKSEDDEGTGVWPLQWQVGNRGDRGRCRARLRLHQRRAVRGAQIPRRSGCGGRGARTRAVRHDGFCQRPRRDFNLSQAGGACYVVVSNQQADTFRIFPRAGTFGKPHDHPLLKSVRLSTRENDGSDVSNVPLPGFPGGCSSRCRRTARFTFTRGTISRRRRRG